MGFFWICSKWEAVKLYKTITPKGGESLVDDFSSIVINVRVEETLVIFWKVGKGGGFSFIDLVDFGDILGVQFYYSFSEFEFDIAFSHDWKCFCNI